MSSVLSALRSSSLTRSRSHHVIRSSKALISRSSGISRTHVSSKGRIILDSSRLSLTNSLPHDAPRGFLRTCRLQHAVLHLQVRYRHRHSRSLRSHKTHTHCRHSRERTNKRLNRRGQLSESIDDTRRKSNQQLKRHHEARVHGRARVLQSVLESLNLSRQGIHDDVHRLINERRALRSPLSLLQLLHIQADTVRHTGQQLNVTHVLEAQVLNRLSLLNLVTNTCEVLQDALEHLVRVILPQLTELFISHTDSLGVGVHLVATLSGSGIDRIEDTLKRAARPFLWDSERRQRRRQSKNLILSKASRLTLGSNRHSHVRNLRLSSHRLRTKISDLISQDRVAVTLARCRLLQLAHHLTETTKRSRSRLDFHTRHSRELSDSLRKVFQLVRRNVHLRTERTNLRQISKRRGSCCRKLSVSALQFTKRPRSTLRGTLHVSKRTLLRNTSLSSRRHQYQP